MDTLHKGRQTIVFDRHPVILAHSAIAGKKESEGPLAGFFDHTETDTRFGQKTWEKAESTMQERVLRRALEQAGLSQVRICVETMGKIHVLGDAGEVIRICQADERLLPCIDFGHLNARTQGGLSTREQLSALLDALWNGLGAERAVHFHAHFSHIEYGRGGEIRHLTFADTQYGPDFAPLAALLAERGLAPRIICESAGTQSEDACTMKALFLQAAQHSVSALL